MLSRRTTSVLTCLNFFVRASLVIAALLIINALLLIASFLVIDTSLVVATFLFAGPRFIVQAFLFLRSLPVCVLPGIPGRARRAGLSLRSRRSLRRGCGAPANK